MDGVIVEIAKKHLANMSVRKAASEINKYLPIGRGYSAQAIASWMGGKRTPDFFIMYYLAQNSHGWVYRFAAEMLMAMVGDIFQTENIIPPTITIEKIDAVCADHARGMQAHAIALKYGLSVPAVRTIIEQGGS